MKKIILILVVILAGIALYYSFSKGEPITVDQPMAIDEPIAVIDDEVDDNSHYYGEELDIVAIKLHKYVKDRNIDSLATLFFYPISRKYPTRDILDEQEFVERYEEIFDEAFCDKITSDPYNWSSAGWRGYMYDRGDLWVDYGDSLIFAVNVYSEANMLLHNKEKYN